MKLSWICIYVLSFFIITLQFSCDFNLAGDVSIKEVKRISSPDHTVDAILIETDAGATTSTSGKVFIARLGKKITTEDFTSVVFNCDNFSMLDMSWKTNNELRISYFKARIFNHLNKWKSDDHKYEVSISLDSTSKR